MFILPLAVFGLYLQKKNEYRYSMKEFVISEAKAETAVLVGLITQSQDEAKTKEYLDELEFLADTAGAVTVKRFTQKVAGPNQTSYVGKGKLQEIKQYIDEEEENGREIVHPGRIVPATCEIVDIAGLVKGASKGEGLGNKFLGKSTIMTISAVTLESSLATSSSLLQANV